ncbi:MAG: UvrD-helicase domain-containing protein, partial [Solobacterium sp.]|nr:UvrD-helicase domain-containing protein [Solobacterium sp.]
MQEKERQLRTLLTLNTPDEGNKNYSVVAGAGAGKTTLLSFRISKQIALGTPIEEFVIITYTNAAATELREKIADRLKDLLNECTDEIERKRIVDALDNIELMQISTIHSFLLKLLREAAFESQVTLDARLLDSNKQEDELRKKEFFEEWYEEHYKEIGTFQKDWRIKNTKGYYIDHTREALENMFMSMANIREEVVLGNETEEVVFDKWVKHFFNHWLDILVEYRDAIIDDQPIGTTGKPKAMNKNAQEIKDYITQAENAFNHGRYGMEEALLLSDALKKADAKNLRIEQKYYRDSQDPTPSIDEVTKKLYKMMEEDPNWKLSDLKKNVLDFYEVSTKLARYVLKMKNEYQSQIDRNTSELSNDDILFRSEQLLLNHPEVLNKLRERYSKIYVDEFQDTTLLQTNIVKLLSSLEDSTLEEEKLEENKLIVVGDPKQSIYRFSGTERSVYDDVNRMMNALPQAEVVELNTNFRSNVDIIDWVNKTFSKTMGSDYNPMETDWVVQNKNALHGVYQYVAKDDEYNLEADVEAVVELVSELVNNDKIFIESIDRNQNYTLQRIKYSDIMIITKVTTNMSYYVKALSQAGIPVNVSGKFAIGENEILRNYALLVSYLANPKDNKKYYEALQVLTGH